MIPTFDHFLRPILALAAKGPITRRSIQPLLAEQFKLTEAEVLQRFPSGSSTILANRSGWAMTFLTKAGLIEKVSPKTYSASPAGLEILKSHPSEITEADLKQLPGWEEAWEACGRPEWDGLHRLRLAGRLPRGRADLLRLQPRRS